MEVKVYSIVKKWAWGKSRPEIFVEFEDSYLVNDKIDDINEEYSYSEKFRGVEVDEIIDPESIKSAIEKRIKGIELTIKYQQDVLNKLRGILVGDEK